MIFFRKRRRRKCVLRNGRLMLEEMIASFNGKSNPIRSFSAPIILKATNNFDPNLTFPHEDIYECYKGIIEDLPVLVKRVSSWFSLDEDWIKGIHRDIAVSSQMSSHRNVLKLLGCCLEFPNPVLVFEYAGKGPLSNYHGGLATGETLPWNVRLKIAKETASAIAYLHTKFPKRMVHGNITPDKIFIGEKWTAKFTDFSESFFIPDGEQDVKSPFPVPLTGARIETHGPWFYRDSRLNESFDVFSFGNVLFVLITGKPSFYLDRDEDGLPTHLEVFKADTRENVRVFDRDYIILKDLVANASEKGRLIEILDPRLVDEAVAEEAIELQQMKWKAFIELALKCTSYKREDRPDMVEVAKELARIEKIH